MTGCAGAADRTPSCAHGSLAVEEDPLALVAAGAGPGDRCRWRLLRVSGPAGGAPVRGPPLDIAGARVRLAAGVVCGPAAPSGRPPARAGAIALSARRAAGAPRNLSPAGSAAGRSAAASR